MTTPLPLRQLRHASTKADPLGLTRRERQVAELLGWASVSTVAATLGIADATVVRHRQGIYRKLRISTRDELRGWMALSGLSEPFEAELDRAAHDLDPRTLYPDTAGG